MIDGWQKTEVWKKDGERDGRWERTEDILFFLPSGELVVLDLPRSHPREAGCVGIFIGFGIDS